MKESKIKTILKKVISILILSILFYSSLFPLTVVKADNRKEANVYEGRRFWGYNWNHTRKEDENWTKITSTSRRMLEIMISQSGFSNFVINTDYNYHWDTGDDHNNFYNELRILEVTTPYTVPFPDNYFEIYLRGDWGGGILNPKPKYSDENRIEGFDFTGEKDLGDTSLLPNFSSWTGAYKPKIILNHCNIPMNDLINAVEERKFDGTRMVLKEHDYSDEEIERLKKVVGNHEAHHYIDLDLPLPIYPDPEVPIVIDDIDDTDDKEDDTNDKEDDTNNKEDDTSDKNDDSTKINTSSIDGILGKLKCTDSALKALRQGDFKTFNNWFNNYAYQYVSNITRAEAQFLVNELGRLSNYDYKYEITGGFSDDPAVIEDVNVDPAGWYNLTYPTELEYKNHKFYLDGNIEEYDGFNNKIGDISPYIYYIDPKKNDFFAGWGSAEIPVKYNGHYIVFIGLYGGGLWHRYDYDVTDIDDQKPYFEKTLTYDKSILDGGAYGKKLNITAFDNSALKSISVDDREVLVSGTQRTISFNIVQTGDYKIRVTDKAGNFCEETMHIEVDRTGPVIQKYNVTRKNQTLESLKSLDTSYCIAKKGDTITVTLQADEIIKCYGERSTSVRRYVTLNEIPYDLGNDKSKSIEVNSDTITFDVQLTDELMEDLTENNNGSSSCWVDIKVYGITDKTNNEIDYTIKNALYIDNSAPVIEGVEISGGGSSDVAGVTFIQPDTSVTIDVLVDEKLAKNPTVTIGGISDTATYYSEVYRNKKKLYMYKLNVNCNALINIGGLANNSVIPVVIKNCEDLVGNKTGNYTVDKNNTSSNGKYLYYGTINAGEVYIAETSVNQIISREDANRDGFVTNYDYLLYNRFVLKIEKNENEQYIFNDINSDGVINTKDAHAVSKTAKTTINEIKVNESKTFKIYNANNEQIKGSNLSWQLLDNNGTVINSDNTAIQITKNATDGTLTIVPQNTTIPQITINVNYENGGNLYQTQLKLNIKNNTTSSQYKGIIKVETENKNIYDIVGDIDNDGFVTEADANAISGKGLPGENLPIPSGPGGQRLLLRGDLNKDGVINASDASIILKNVDKYFTLKKGENVDLKLMISQSNRPAQNVENFKDESIQNQLTWEVVGDTTGNILGINQGENGIATVTANGQAGDKAIIKATMKIKNTSDEIVDVVSYFYIEIAGSVDIKLDKKEMEFKLTGEQTENLTLSANLNISNKLIEWKSSNENVARIEVDDLGNVNIVPVASGKTTIDITCDGVTESCEINITQGVNNIEVNKSSISLKEGSEETVQITTNSDATEKFLLSSSNESVARIYFDEETNSYKVKAIKAGNATIEIASPSDDQVKKTINVNVEALKKSNLTEVTLDNKKEKYSIGDKLFIRLKFDDIVAGNAPDLIIRFGNYRSINETEFVGFEDNNTSLVYSYEIAEGDNGKITVEKLVGGSMKDDTLKLNVNQSLSNNKYNAKYNSEDGENEQENSDGVAREGQNQENSDGVAREGQNQENSDGVAREGQNQENSDGVAREGQNQENSDGVAREGQNQENSDGIAKGATNIIRSYSTSTVTTRGSLPLDRTLGSSDEGDDTGNDENPGNGENTDNGGENNTDTNGETTGNGEGNNTDDEEEYINDSIYVVIDDTTVDTTKPTITLDTVGRKHWLKIGDEIIVTLIASKNLKNAPKVYFNGIEATVTGENQIFYASMTVTDELEEGYLTIKVNDYEDELGNSGEEFIASKFNIDEPLLIDNTAPVVESVTAILQNGKTYKAGDSFDILVKFNDPSRGKFEYIKADEAPELKLKFGNNDAKGTITSDYTPGQYVQKIRYTYTLSKDDIGELTIDEIIGNIQDAAGNETNLNQKIDKATNLIIEEEKTEEEKTEEEKQDKEAKTTEEEKTAGQDTTGEGENTTVKENDSKDNKNNDTNKVETSKNTKETKDNGSSKNIDTPKTGDQIIITIVTLTIAVTGLMVEWLFRRKQNKK